MEVVEVGVWHVGSARHCGCVGDGGRGVVLEGCRVVLLLASTAMGQGGALVCL